MGGGSDDGTGRKEQEEVVFMVHDRDQGGMSRRLAAVLGAAAILAAGCTSGGTPTTGPGGSAAGQDYAAAVAKAKLGFPDKWSGPTAPAKAPSGIKLAMISCVSVLHGCQSPVDGGQHAAQALGWQFQAYDGGGDPNKQNAAILNAIAYGANVIGLVAIDPNLVQSGIQAAKAKNILVVSGSSALSEPNTYTYGSGVIPYEYDVAPDYGQMGKDEADWIVNDSGGKAVVAIYCDYEFPSNLAHCLPLEAELKAAGVKTYPIIKFTSSTVGTTLGGDTVGFLKSHPDVNYIYSPYDPAAGFQVPAIATAGLADKVKLVSILGDQQNLDFIRKGEVEVADAAYDNEYMGYAIVDQAIRLLDKLPLSHPLGENMPYVLLDKTNLPAAGSDWHATFDYKTEFMNLWK
jgi:ribose transport system substrate-binding protein